MLADTRSLTLRTHIHSQSGLLVASKCQEFDSTGTNSPAALGVRAMLGPACALVAKQARDGAAGSKTFRAGFDL